MRCDEKCYDGYNLGCNKENKELEVIMEYDQLEMLLDVFNLLSQISTIRIENDEAAALVSYY
jgi:hypothetical protein